MNAHDSETDLEKLLRLVRETRAVVETRNHEDGLDGLWREAVQMEALAKRIGMRFCPLERFLYVAVSDRRRMIELRLFAFRPHSYAFEMSLETWFDYELDSPPPENKFLLTHKAWTCPHDTLPDPLSLPGELGLAHYKSGDRERFSPQKWNRLKQVYKEWEAFLMVTNAGAPIFRGVQEPTTVIWNGKPHKLTRNCWLLVDAVGFHGSAGVVDTMEKIWGQVDDVSDQRLRTLIFRTNKLLEAKNIPLVYRLDSGFIHAESRLLQGTSSPDDDVPEGRLR